MTKYEQIKCFLQLLASNIKVIHLLTIQIFSKRMNMRDYILICVFVSTGLVLDSWFIFHVLMWLSGVYCNILKTKTSISLKFVRKYVYLHPRVRLFN